MYAHSDNIADADRDITNFLTSCSLPIENAAEYAQTFWTKAPGCRMVFHEYSQSRLFIKELQQVTRQSVYHYWAKKFGIATEIRQNRLSIDISESGSAKPDLGPSQDPRGQMYTAIMLRFESLGLCENDEKLTL